VNAVIEPVTNVMTSVPSCLRAGTSQYNGCMNEILDKAIVFLCCLPALLLVSFSGGQVVAFLLAVAVASLYEVVPAKAKPLLLVAYLAIAVFVPALCLFLPVVVYDCFRMEKARIVFRLAGVLPLLGVVSSAPSVSLLYIVVLALGAALLSLRTLRQKDERIAYRALRDELREMSLALESKNRDLQEAQDYEVRLATLNERGRIAREIHDNVGHLLTRAIMQVEALQVVHAEVPGVRADFEEVGVTLHEAMDTVRASVHDLHDESLDVRAQVETALASCGITHTRLSYEVDDLPAAVGYCFLAIVREALSNTVRHSDAHAIEVDIRAYPGLFRLVVQDDGSATEITDGSGMGLQAMEDRVRALDGVFRTEYRHGFRVFVSVPR
jgi:signal transduction histidine kinase